MKYLIIFISFFSYDCQAGTYQKEMNCDNYEVTLTEICPIKTVSEILLCQENTIFDKDCNVKFTDGTVGNVPMPFVGQTINKCFYQEDYKFLGRSESFFCWEIKLNFDFFNKIKELI